MAARKSILDPELTELALTLLDNGYEPIPVKGKAPMWKGWQRRPITREAIEQNNWRPHGHTNTGIRTKYTPAIDNDIHDPKIAAAAAEAAVKVVGYNISERVGSKGALTVYRTDAP